MAIRPFWKGYLKLSLVTCPVTMQLATTEAEKVKFRLINATTGHRIATRSVDSVTGKPLRDKDEAKGYQHGEDQYVILEDDELDAVALDSTRSIDIQTFIPADSIGWIWYDTPHYLFPSDRVGEEAFGVIRAAMEDTATVGIARLVLYRRERAVMLKARGKGIELWTLRYGEEVRDPDDYFSKIKADKPDAKALKLITELIKERTTAWNPDMTSDPVQEHLLDLIAAKKKGRKRAGKAKPVPARSDNVVSIMDALRRSLDAEKRKK